MCIYINDSNDNIDNSMCKHMEHINNYDTEISYYNKKPFGKTYYSFYNVRSRGLGEECGHAPGTGQY